MAVLRGMLDEEKVRILNGIRNVLCHQNIDLIDAEL